ncbi:Mut7-C RNAse domain-containing protein, partial [Candidatus Bathyarchaeota archaeon]|nr:Mut7-C RNAse domain-containing protein [Candidatus Bathyarchaeota archaeon]
MLGKLTRWLRILGHDVAYSTKLDDDCLITVSKRERRVLLTRDLELFKRATAKGIDVFYVDGKTEEEKLARLAKRFGFSLDVDMTKSRCPK